MNFKPGCLYHVYNRGNNSQEIFFNDENYLFFLRKIRIYIICHCKILAYCLMPNHFHFLLYTNCDLVSNKLNMGFAILLRSYTRAIDKQRRISGSLFQQKTKSKCLNEIKNRNNNTQIISLSDYGYTCFNYIHQNPVNAGLVSKMEDWKYSSFIDYWGKRNGTLCDKELAKEMIEIPVGELFYKLSYESVKKEYLEDIL